MADLKWVRKKRGQFIVWIADTPKGRFRVQTCFPGRPTCNAGHDGKTWMQYFDNEQRAKAFCQQQYNRMETP